MARSRQVGQGGSTEEDVNQDQPICFFAFCSARGLAHSPRTPMHLSALEGLYSFAEPLLQCIHVLPFLSCFCCLLSTIVSTTLNARGPAH